jgi:PAS domain S-box-containing protein
MMLPDPAPAPAVELELFRSLFAAHPDAMLLVDSQGLIVLANPQATELLGYAAHEWAGLPVDALVPDGIRSRHADYRQAYAQQPRARPMGTQIALVARRRDGSEVMVEIALSPLREHGLPYVVASVRGIDSYPRVQQAMRRARYSECVAQMARLAVDEPAAHLMMQSLALAVAETLDVQSVVVLLLEPGRREFRVAAGTGLLPTETLGMPVPNSADTPAGYAALQAASVAVRDFRAERRFPVPEHCLANGLLSALVVPLSDRGEVMGVLTVRCNRVREFQSDELQFAESLASLLATRLQRERSEQALQHAQRLETVGQLTGGIAHDFNNLLTIVQGNLQVLQEHPALQHDESAAASVQAALRASLRGAELTNKLLAFSRRQTLSPRPLDVGGMLHALAGMLRRTLDRSIEVQVQTPQQALHCLADPGQLESALLNLAVNARDAMPGGGVLRFACHALPQAQGDLAQELAPGRAYVAIEVSDTGCGMTAEVSERAFEPFFTTKDVGRGTGMGLSTVYGFVKQSLGAVRLRSAPGQGTTLTLMLPSAATPGEAAVPGEEPHLPQGLRVLLVEDQAEVRHTVARTLADLGCTVVALDNAEQALRHLASQDTPELLLSDVALGPGLRGTELARRARQHWPGMARLLMSGYANEARAAGDDELLRKPFDRATLAAAMLRALAAVSAPGSTPG